MNMRAAFSLAEAPAVGARMAEPVMAALAEGVSAVFFDNPQDTGRARLTCLLDGAPVAPPFLCTSLDLVGGGRRHLAVLARPLAALLERRVALALDGRAEAMADPAWLQPPVRDAQALVDRLTPAARLRLLRLLLGAGASLFLRERPSYPGLLREMLALCGAQAAAPAAQAVFGGHQILTYRLDAPLGAGETVALTPDRIWPLRRGVSFHHEAAAGLLHAHLPVRLGPGAEAVVLEAQPLRLLGAPEGLPALPPARWALGRDAGAAAWLAERLRAAAAESPALATVAREMRAEAVQPRLAIRHLSATPAGLVHALELTDPEGFVQAIRIERGGGRVEIAPRLRLDGAGTLAGFAALPGGAEDSCRIALLHHSGRLRPVHEGVPAAYDGAIPPGFAAALEEARAAGLPGAAVAALAAARASLPARDLPVQIQAFGALERPALTLLAPAGDNPDLIRARAAMVFAEPGGRRVELMLTVAEGPGARALRRIVAEATAIHGLAHRIVTLPPDATPAEALRAGLAATRGGGVLVLGAAALPEGRGWLAAWRRRLGRGGIVGGLLLASDGAVAHAGDPRLAGLAPAWLPARARREGLALSDEAVGFSRESVERMVATGAHHPDPRVLLAAFAAEEKRAGRKAVTDLSFRIRRYGAPPAEAGLAAELRAAEMARVLAGATC